MRKSIKIIYVYNSHKAATVGADPLKGAPLKGLDKRDAIRKDEILSAIVKSGRSYEEIMNFLNVEETERETKE